MTVGILFLSSCEKDFLNIENPNDLSAASFWSSESEIQQGLVATYGALQLQGMLGGSSAIQHPVRSDVGRPNNWNANAIGLNTLTYNENTQIVGLRWRDAYIGIYRANQVLANLSNVEMSTAVSTQMEAEARFLRAFFYNSLYRGYNGGSVIIHTTVPEMRNDFYKKPSPATDVYALILEDLEFAYQNLPQSYDDSADLGRATWGAATAMLGKLHLNEHNYEGAKGYFKEILDSNLYMLTADIGDNFDEEHEFNSESIFEVAFSIDAKPGTSFGAQDGPTGSEATNRAIGLATTQGGGFRTVMPSYYMTMLFKNDVMDMTNPINASRTGSAPYSIRTSVSVAIADDDNTTLYQRSSDEGGAYNNNEASYLKKFQNWKLQRESDLSVSGINERVIRLADVMLLYTECVLKTSGDLDEVMSMINAIRDRAGVVNLRKSIDFNYNENPTTNFTNDIDFNTDTIKIGAHAFIDGQELTYNSDTPLTYCPNGMTCDVNDLPSNFQTLDSETSYYVIVVDYEHIKLATSKQNAFDKLNIDFTETQLKKSQNDNVLNENISQSEHNINYNTNSIMEHIMWVERPLELMFEGHDLRWEDLTRWGKVKEQYVRLAAKSYVISGKVLFEYDPAAHGSLNKIKEFVEAANVYSPEAHDYFPIPATELNSNPDFLD
ncbi:MAG: RagB/SusD family nutrient uptake outer membrane protein [Bacteroidetes bacterium]|nr:RagB/SusD family nutrient uptake outer membrane protein [Bacteroidota bacterium]